MKYKLLKLTLIIPYYFLKLLPTNKNKVVFISRQSKKPSIDFILLKHEILTIKPNFKVVFCCKKIKKTTIGFIKYYLSLFIEMYHLATSKVCVTDGYNITVSVLNHKKNLKIIQIWHAIATVKKFGHQTIGKKYGRNREMADNLNMHAGYDYVISGSRAMKPVFAKTFNVPIKKIKTTGTPRIDYLLKEGYGISKSIKNKYKNLNNKKVILYAPTFRKNKSIDIKPLMETIDFSKYNLIVKCHPTKKQKFIEKGIYTCDEYTSMQLLTVCDYVITDYSAISVEAAILNKPVYFYLYDYEEYIKNNGININLKREMNGYCYSDFKRLYDKLETEKYDYKKLKKYKDKYVENQDGNATNILANYIITGKWLDNKKNKKEGVLNEKESIYSNVS